MANSKKNTAKQVSRYRYGDKRKDNLNTGMADTTSDRVEGHTTWTYDPHIDPTLNFDSVWTGIENLKGIKAELNEALPVRFQTLSFKPGDNQIIVVKVAADRKIESPQVAAVTS